MSASAEEVRKFLESQPPKQPQKVDAETVRAFLHMHDAPVVQESPHKTSKLAELGASITAATPFAKEIGSALGAANDYTQQNFDSAMGKSTPHKSFGEMYRGNIAANDQALADAHKDIPGAGLITLAARAPQFAIKGPQMAVNGAIGGITGAAEAGGDLKHRALVGGESALAAMLLGKVADKAVGVGARKLLPIIGGATGFASADGGVVNKGVGAAEGATIGYGAARFGGKYAGKAIEGVAKLAKRASPMLSTGERAAAEYGSRLKGGIGDLLSFEGGRGAIAADVGGHGTPLQGYAETVLTYPGEQTSALAGTIRERAKFAPDNAEKAARKAIGSQFVKQTPVAKEARRRIGAESNPLYAKLEGVEANADVLKQLVQNEPRAREYLEFVRDLSERAAKAPGATSTPLPKLFDVGEDGTLQFLRDTYPVLGIDELKQNLRSFAQSTKGSKMPFTRAEAKVFEKYLAELTKSAKRDVPDYAAALKGHGDISDKVVDSLADRKRLEQATLGNSRTAARLKGQEGFEAGTRFETSPHNLLQAAVQSQMKRWSAGLNNSRANASAGFLNRPVESLDERVDLAREIVAAWKKISHQNDALSTVPKGVALGSGLLVGRANQEKQPQGQRRGQ